MDRSRSNVLLLALCQAAFISTSALMATIGTLAGHALAADKALATLPATAVTIGTALGTIPASFIMRRVGRRLGFIVGSGFTMTGGLVGAVAVLVHSFWLLIGGGFLMGLPSAFAQLYRFAAAHAAVRNPASNASANGAPPSSVGSIPRSRWCMTGFPTSVTSSTSVRSTPAAVHSSAVSFARHPRTARVSSFSAPGLSIT